MVVGGSRRLDRLVWRREGYPRRVCLRTSDLHLLHLPRHGRRRPAPGADPMSPTSGVRGLVAKGLGWTAMTQVVSQFARMIVAVLLARMLTPHDYGVAGMVLVF